MNQNHNKEPKKGSPRNKRTKQRIIDLSKRISKKVAGIRPKEPLEVPLADSYILGMYWRSVSLFEAIVTLLEKDLTEEALILARSLFVESLHLAELADAGKERTVLVLGWINDSIKRKKGLVHDAARVGLEQNPKNVIRALEKEQNKIQGYARRHGVGQSKKFLSEGSATLKFDRKDDYWNYLLGHQMVHGSDAAYLYRRHNLTKDTVGVFLRTSDVDIICEVAFFAARSVLQVTQSTVKIFNWGDTSDLEKLLYEVNNFPGLEKDADL